MIAVHVSHLGFSADGTKRAVIRLPEPGMRPSCALVALGSGRRTPLPAAPATLVDGWSTGAYTDLDFSDVRDAGRYRIEATLDGVTVSSSEFEIATEVVHGQTLSDVLYYFKSVRSSGEIDRKDRTARLWNDSTGLEIDARGGWLDASGDTSKFLSHLTYTPMMEPQQLPLCAWAFLEARDRLAATHPRFARILGARLRDEALWGADFLVRFRHPDGYFFSAIFDALTKKLDERIICAPLAESVRTDHYQASYRGGGGLAIAALARASREAEHGDFTQADYLDAARRAFDDLEANNLRYRFDDHESIIDDYGALLAATELGAATGEPAHRAAAEKRARSLIDRYRTPAEGPGWFEGFIDGRPFFHAAEAGLPVIALVRFAEVYPDSPVAASAEQVAVVAMRDATIRTDAVANPFGYPRQPTQVPGRPASDTFFFPHENETGYWWQGENSTISSLAYAALRVADRASCPPDLADRLRRFADDQVHWILGGNPFDVCMLQGRGRGNPEYEVSFPNVPGGIVNGITSGVDDESDIAFLTAQAGAGDDAWRWTEQWIPHSAWFILAMSAVR